MFDLNDYTKLDALYEKHKQNIDSITLLISTLDIRINYDCDIEYIKICDFKKIEEILHDARNSKEITINNATNNLILYKVEEM